MPDLGPTADVMMFEEKHDHEDICILLNSVHVIAIYALIFHN